MRYFFIIIIALLLLLGNACQVAEKRMPEAAVAGPIRRVYLVPLNDIDSASVAYLSQGIADSFGVPVKILAARSMPANAWYEPRKRYWADSLLPWLKPISTHFDDKVLGVTGRDLSTRKGPQYNWGIMGLGMNPGPACIVSDYRLHRHGLTAGQVQYRLLKVALHELGHTTGLPHCPTPTCLMVDAEGQDKLDSQMGFCRECRKHLFRP